MNFEELLSNALKEEQAYDKRESAADIASGPSLQNLHFRTMSIENLCLVPNEMLQTVFAKNGIALASPLLQPEELRRVVFFEKFFHLHTVLYDDHECGHCQKVVNISKRCSNCKLHRYCNKECQSKHWKVHKTFCNLLKKRNTERKSHNMCIVKDKPEMIEKVKSFLMSKQWDGNENKFFDDSLKAVGLLIDNTKVLTLLFSSLPPTVVQGYGPCEFMKVMNFIMEKCLATPFIHEKKMWLEVLEDYFDPHWPECNSSPETLFLKPNVEVYLEQGGLDFLKRIIAEEPNIAINCTKTLHNISRYRFVISNEARTKLDSFYKNFG